MSSKLLREFIAYALYESSSHVLSEVKLVGGSEAVNDPTYRVYELMKFNDKADLQGGNFIIVPTEMDMYDRNEKGHLSGDSGVSSYARKALGVPAGAQKPGFHISETDSLLVNHETETIDLDTTERANYKSRRGPKNGGRKSYTIPHADVSFHKVHSLQKVLKALKQIDKQLTDDYVIIGNPTYDDMTVGDVLKAKRPGDQIVKGGQAEPITLYHGTSAERLPKIKQMGLVPGNAPAAYVDQVKGYSEKNVYLTTSVSTAQNYATRAAVEDGGKAVVIKVIVRDPTNFVVDEDMTGWMKVKGPDGNEEEIHFKHSYWWKWPNADEIMQKYMSKIAKSTNSSGTVAYRGRIPAKDITVKMTYKPASMPKEPDGEEYSDAREKTLASVTKGEDKPKTPRKAATKPT